MLASSPLNLTTGRRLPVPSRSQEAPGRLQVLSLPLSPSLSLSLPLSPTPSLWLPLALEKRRGSNLYPLIVDNCTAQPLCMPCQATEDRRPQCTWHIPWVLTFGPCSALGCRIGISLDYCCFCFSSALAANSLKFGVRVCYSLVNSLQVSRAQGLRSRSPKKLLRRFLVPFLSLIPLPIIEQPTARSERGRGLRSTALACKMI